MAFGITSESQLIDYNTINNGCTVYMSSLDNYSQAAKLVAEAAELCDKKALNVNGKTLQPILYELAQKIASIGNEYATYVNDLNTNAVNVYNAQAQELNSYYQQLSQQQTSNDDSTSTN